MTSTMATLEMDNNPFIPVTKAHTTKKAQAANQAGAQAKPKIKMELCLVFQLPCQPTTTFNPLLKSNSYSQKGLNMTHQLLSLSIWSGHVLSCTWPLSIQRNQIPTVLPCAQPTQMTSESKSHHDWLPSLQPQDYHWYQTVNAGNAYNDGVAH